MFYIMGLGNPGEEYQNSRHNTGKMAVEFFNNKNDLSEKKFKVIDSAEFMNHSGKAVAKFIKSKKSAENLIVVYDDLDLPLGSMKISYNKGDGGHRGLESVIKAVKTREFTRIRIGISPHTPSGKLKKPGLDSPAKQAEKKVLDFILGNFSPKESEELKKTFKKASEAVECLVTEGRDRAMNLYN